MRDFSQDLSALALNTATLGHNLDGYGAGWPPERIIDACAKRGISGVVFWRREIGSKAAEIGERARSTGVKIAGLCRSPFLVGPLAADSDAAIMDAFHESIDMTAALGAPVLTIVTGGTDPGTKGLIDTQKRLSDRVARGAGYAKQAGISLALEPLNPAYGGSRTCLMTVRDALRVCNWIDSLNVGIAVDVYHVWWDTALRESLAEAKGRIFGYHLCDWLADTQDVLLDRGMMGDGIADLPAIRSAVEAAGYEGPCEVEIFSARNWWKRDPEDVLDTVIKRFQTVC